MFLSLLRTDQQCTWPFRELVSILVIFGEYMNAQKGSYLLKTLLTLDFTLNFQGNNTTSAFCPVLFYVPRPVPSIQLALLSIGESSEAGSCRIYFQELRNG